MTSDEISRHILALLDAAKVDHPVAARALFGALHGVLVSILCADCRQKVIKDIRDELPRMLYSAEREAATLEHIDSPGYVDAEHRVH
jgi:hypothetical protein